MPQPRRSAARLALRCADAFDPPVRARGAGCFRQGRVARIGVRAGGLRAAVHGSQPRPYATSLAFIDGLMLRLECNCEHAHGLDLCKHMWALVLAFDERKMAIPLEGRGSVDVIVSNGEEEELLPAASPDEDDEDEDEDDEDEDEDEDEDADEDEDEDEEGEAVEATPSAVDDADDEEEPSPLDRPSLDDDEFDEEPRPWRGSSWPQSRGTLVGRVIPGSGWRDRLEMLPAGAADGSPLSGAAPRLRGGELEYQLDLEASSDQELHVRTVWRPKQGASGRRQAWLVDASMVGALEGDDRELAALLGGCRAVDDRGPAWSKPRRSSVVITPLGIDRLLPRLCATGRCGFRPEENEAPVVPLRWDADEPFDFRAWIDRAPDRERAPDHGGVQASGVLVRGDERLALADVRLIAAHFFAVEGRVVRLAQPIPEEWRRTFAGRGLVAPAEDEHAFVQALARHRVPLALSPELGWKVRRVEPAPVLRALAPRQAGDGRTLRRRAGAGRVLAGLPETRERDDLGGPPGSAAVVLAFDYAGEVIEARSRQRLVVASPAQTTASARGARANGSNGSGRKPPARMVIERDEASEARHRVALESLAAAVVGEEAAPADGTRGCAEAFVPPAALASIVEGALAFGFRVEAEGKPIRRSGAFSLEVKSGIDWFDLHVSGDFAGAKGSGLEASALLSALGRGERFVRLGDGSVGILPEEWLGRWGVLAAAGRAEGDGIRFARAQGALLDAMLADEKVELDAGFRRFRTELRGFAGVKPEEPPGAFEGVLRPYQKEGLGWLRFLDRFGFGGCLADDMGLGKTIQVLALFAGRDEQRKGRPSIIVAPKSLVANWVSEAARFAPKLRVVAHHGKGRSSVALGRADVVVTTYGTLVRDIESLAKLPFDYAVLDEAQAVKNERSHSARACRLLTAEHRLALTGTPVENSLADLASIFEFVNPGMIGGVGALQALGRARVPGSEDMTLLRRGLRPFLLRRTKEQVLADLPPKTEQTLRCPLSGPQRRLYQELRDHYRASLGRRVASDGIERSKIHVLEALLRLRQVACHAGLVDPKRVHEPSAKLDALLEQLTEVVAAGHKAIVFSQFTSFLAIVRARLDALGVTYAYLDGQLAARARSEAVSRFQNEPSCSAFLVSLKAGGLGLNLTAADYVFLLDPWWNPAVEAQAVDRSHRIGQKRPVFAYRLVAAGTVEEKVVELQRGKRALYDGVMANDEGFVASLTASDLEALLS